jgi:hypothetical protein
MLFPRVCTTPESESELVVHNDVASMYGNRSTWSSRYSMHDLYYSES